MLCKNCGNQNLPGANFCSSCGASLATGETPRDDATATFQALDLGDAQAEAELEESLDDLSPDDAMLFVKRGSNAGATYLLDSDVVRAGRHPDNEIFLDDVTVSRRHAEFQRGEGYQVRDVGSLNGTYVNGKLVESAPLHHGDEVQVGKFKLVFLKGPAKR